MGPNAIGGFMWAGMLISGVLGLALIILLVVGIVWLVRQLGRQEGRRRGDPSAIAEIELRYARGEVDRETYLAIRRDLEADDS